MMQCPLNPLVNHRHSWPHNHQSRITHMDTCFHSWPKADTAAPTIPLHNRCNAASKMPFDTMHNNALQLDPTPFLWSYIAEMQPALPLPNCTWRPVTLPNYIAADRCKFIPAPTKTRGLGTDPSSARSHTQPPPPHPHPTHTNHERPDARSCRARPVCSTPILSYVQGADVCDTLSCCSGAT